jgi:MFS family permease
VFALAIAIQMLLWGAAQPFVGAIADRFGPVLVLAAGAVLYAIGLAWMANAATPAVLYLSAGFMIGFGLAGASFTVVIGAFGKLLPPEWRTIGFGLGTAAGSFGQFLFSPIAVGLNNAFPWQTTLIIFGAIVLLVIPLSFALAFPREMPSAQPVAQQSVMEALREAFAHRSYMLLVLGFFTCGFQVFFITVHLPAYLVDRGLSADIGAWTVAVIGLFNIIGSISSGWLSNKLPKRYILAVIYFARALAVVFLITLPASPAVALIYGAMTGLLWLSSVPPTAGLVAVMFGTRWMAMLFGIAFFSHQVGGFLGIYLGGALFERTGSYDIVWWLGVLFGVISAIINLPIVEKPVARLAPAPA